MSQKVDFCNHLIDEFEIALSCVFLRIKGTTNYSSSDLYVSMNDISRYVGEILELQHPVSLDYLKLV